MAIADIGIFSMLRTRMQWHQERQKVLAENVANSDTPNYRPRDLVPLKFDSLGPAAPGAPLTLTNVAHQAGAEGETTFARTQGGFAIRPAGNAVSLEEQMSKVAENQMDFQAASALYTKSLGLMKLAIGRR
jgi:flagellar basal-body rod protein FlgB